MNRKFALLSLKENIKKARSAVSRARKSYDSLEDKGSQYALDHLILISVYEEVLSVFLRHYSFEKGKQNGKEKRKK